MPRTHTKINVIIAGNIGSGKSTQIESLRQKLLTDDTLFSMLNRRPSVIVTKEPVDSWRSSGALKVFYEERLRNPSVAIAWQNYVLATRAQEYYKSIEACPSDADYVIHLSDGWVYTDRGMFVNAAVEMGGIEPGAKKMYDLTFEAIAKTFRCEPNSHTLVFDMDVSPKETRARINTRGRTEESGIPMDYLNTLERHLKAFLKTVEEGAPGAPSATVVKVPNSSVDNTTAFITSYIVGHMNLHARGSR